MALQDGFKYEPVLPLDRMILDFLPKEGSTFAGIYPIGETAKAFTVKVTKSQIPTSMASARFRLMHKVGLIVSVNAPGKNTSGHAWQITEAGQQQLAEWKSEPVEATDEQH